MNETVIGRDLLPVGRLFRLLGAGLITALLVSAARHHHLSTSAVMERVVPAFVVTAGVYTIVIRLVGERLLTRLDGWLAALLLTGPSIIIAALPVTPVAIAGGIWLNVAAGMLAQVIIGYGGCEVAGISSLLLRRRYRVYCALNGTDAVERLLRTRPLWIRAATMLLALLVTGGAFALFDAITPGWLANYSYLVLLAIGYLVASITHRTPTEQRHGGVQIPGSLPHSPS